MIYLNYSVSFLSITDELDQVVIDLITYILFLLSEEKDP